MKTTNMDLSQLSKIYVVQNDSSNRIPAKMYPSPKKINDFVIQKDPAFRDISELVCLELQKRQITYEVVQKTTDIPSGSFYIEYQDYWERGSKTYMHVLIIKLYEDGTEIKTVASKADGSGMHDNPTPENQTPLLINLLLSK